MTFVTQEAVRCEDCEIRGDLHDTGYPLPDARGRIDDCCGCGGSAHRVVHAADPYSVPVDPSDPYAIKRAARAEKARITHVPRPLRRRFLSTARLEALMSEESSVALI